MNPLHRAVITTLAYFDAFDRPLTKEELWRWLWIPGGASEHIPQTQAGFFHDLQALKESGALGYINGYYFLPGRDDILNIYQGRVRLVEHKMRRARRAARLIRFVPFVRAVFVCNTIAMGSPKKESDIDVCIVVRRGRMWLARLLVTLLLSAARLRRTKTHINSRVDLSFYVADDALRFSKLRMWDDDVYLAYWILQLIPLYDPHRLLSEMQKENTWVAAFVPKGFAPYALSSRWRVQDRRFTSFVRGFFERIWGGGYGTMMERQAKELQLLKMKFNAASVKDEPDSRVIVSDSMLKFHEKDRRGHYRDAWKKLLAHHLPQ